jgi:hypothetical protein
MRCRPWVLHYPIQGRSQPFLVVIRTLDARSNISIMLSVLYRRTGQPTSQRFRDSIKQGTSAGVYQPLVVFMFNELPPGSTDGVSCDSSALLAVSHVILVGSNFGDAQTRNESTFHSLTSISNTLVET